jgi:antitoxin (DNA-binding transcriptional repressor) of toxin-antitoxin stability system
VGARTGGKIPWIHEQSAAAGHTLATALHSAGVIAEVAGWVNMVYNIVMIMVNIHEAKAKLSEYLEAAAKGERVVICKHNQPVAELRVVEQTCTASRDLAPMYPGETFVTPAFFEPLPADDIAAWEGNGRDVLKVAESRGRYASPTARRSTRKART